MDSNKNKRRVIVVNSSSTFEYRVNLFRKVMEERGWEVLIIGSDYDHIKKCKRSKPDDEQVIYLPTLPYKKNISMARIRSHFQFSNDAFNKIKDMDADLLYIVVPPNSQSGIAKKYKARHPKVKVIMDVIDLWPESFPSSHSESFPFTLWAGVRNRNLKFADIVITECDLYHQYLNKFCRHELQTIYWAHKEELPEETEYIEQAVSSANPSVDKWVLGYLGSVNNIIDIDKICSVVGLLKAERQVDVHIIGAGERMDEFVSALKDAGANVINHGAVYDLKQKVDILSQCHFGINIMKSTVRVGMSMKSVDYLQYGVPVLNGIPGDMEEIVASYHCGINISDFAPDSGSGTDTSKPVLYDPGMRNNARKFYLSQCSFDAYGEQINSII